MPNTIENKTKNNKKDTKTNQNGSLYTHSLNQLH